MNHPVKSFNENLYICEICHKHLNKHEISCQANSNKMALDPIPDELKKIGKNRKIFNFEENFDLKNSNNVGKRRTL